MTTNHKQPFDREAAMRRVNELSSRGAHAFALIRAGFTPGNPDRIGTCADLLREIDQVKAEVGDLVNAAAFDCPAEDAGDTPKLHLVDDFANPPAAQALSSIDAGGDQ
jgi:hypothetical protein